MQKFEIMLGIDVSKSSLDACLVTDPSAKKYHHFKVANDKKGIGSIPGIVRKLGVDTSQMLVCFEHTGVYSMLLCYFLQSKGIKYCMQPAIQIKRSKGLTRGKSDKIDARDIALYALTHQHSIQLSELPEEDLIKLKVMLAEREKLIKAIRMFEMSTEANAYLPKSVLKEVNAVNTKSTSYLKQRLAEIDKLLALLIKANDRLKDQFELINSVPGVGPQTALYLMVVTRCFESFGNWRQLACYAGIAPFEYSSGSSIRGRTKVSHMANKKLKSLLNMAALSAKKHDAQIRQYYERKRNEGKNAMLVMNAIRCKVVSRVFATVKRGTPYVEIAKYAA
jgi:transposase